MDIFNDKNFKNFIENIDNSEYTKIPLAKPAKSSSKPKDNIAWIHSEIGQRINAIGKIVIKSEEQSRAEVEEAVELFRDWMINGTIVRVLGAGRAKLAASIPANRLAHGGARVYIQDDIIPMPHTSKGGGIIAVSASGETPMVLESLKTAINEVRHIKVVGFADKNAPREFKEKCHIFIGINTDEQSSILLQALADIKEYVISELFDAMVVAAGKLAGFDDIEWRVGHENIGPTGPYDTHGRGDKNE